MAVRFTLANTQQLSGTALLGVVLGVWIAGVVFSGQEVSRAAVGRQLVETEAR